MSANDVIGFGETNFMEDSSGNNARKRKKSKIGKKGGGGFQVMGLSHDVLKGIQKRGYKIPTPIQRKTIPIALQGRDLVAMARTGSGKTACFLIPIFERLKARCAKTGARALIMSPTRELALQTVAFIRDIGRYLGLRAAVVLGGDSMDSQFEALHGNPDIIVATPGRFMHVCVEMELKLSSVEIVVFDEADRLFEMGFGEQLKEVVARLPSSRQTLLFSATLPKILVEFTRAGLSDPILLRLDVETKLPEELSLAFLWCRPEEKIAALICLLRQISVTSGSALEHQTVIFAATRHHVEFLHMILKESGFSNTFLYSNLDPSARKINVAKFREGVVKIMVVTDVAARGIDIPDIGTVINFHFPAVPKLFVHRVGRCARAGRSGTAFSLISRDEVPYLVDLHLFLGRPLQLTSKDTNSEETGLIGCIPAEVLEDQHSEVLKWHKIKTDVASMAKVCNNAFKKYLKSRPGASKDSLKRAKQLDLASSHIHPMFGSVQTQPQETIDFLRQIKNFKPASTIFELAPKANSKELKVIKETRLFHEKAIESFHKKAQDRAEREEASQAAEKKVIRKKLAPSNAEDVENTFSAVVAPRKRKFNPDFNKQTKKLKSNVDADNFVPYVAADYHTELGLAVNSFEHAATQVAMDLIGDDERQIQRQQSTKKWDAKKKKMVGLEETPRKIRTESGVWIHATYKSGRYAQWKERAKADEAASDSEDDTREEESRPHQGGGHRGGNRGGMMRGGSRGGTMRGGSRGGMRGFDRNNMRGGMRGFGRNNMRGGDRGEMKGFGRNNMRGGDRGGMRGRQRGSGRSELRRPEQILKEREKKERMEMRQKGKGGRKGARGGGRGRGRKH